MIDESHIYDPDIAQTVRAMYIIDPTHRLRLSLLYPMSTGRCIKLVRTVYFMFINTLITFGFLLFSKKFREILRAIDSLQLTDRVNCIATPANWVVCAEHLVLR